MPVLWERIGKVDVGRADELKLPLEALTLNYVFLNECVWRLILDKGEDENDDAKVRDIVGDRLKTCWALLSIMLFELLLKMAHQVCTAVHAW